MPSPQEDQKRQEATESLQRMLDFDANQLPREKELGTALNFSGAVEPANRLIGLYRRISPTILPDLPQNQLNTLWQQANSDYNILKQVLDFQAGRPVNERDTLITQIDQAYQQAFNKLESLVSFSASKATDFQSLEREARAMMQGVQDQGDKLAKDLDAKSEKAAGILEDIQKAAAEQGVSQQAVYFKEAEIDHDTESNKWLKATIWLAVAMGVYAVASLFLHLIPWLKPTGTSETYTSIQLAVSKGLIFAVISYMLYLSAKNFLAHKHNAIVNKHRQNALMTYTAILNASKSLEQKEIILNHASACIFGPQSTGYAKTDGGDAPSAKSVVELLGKPLMPDT
ncbi:hypothetical protein BVX94_00105 [bacterium B17]|nr:hypothetical protein BVX94_00105 [bacterium B17]